MKRFSTPGSDLSCGRGLWRALVLGMGWLAVLWLGGCAAPSRDALPPFYTVVVDAGHGGHDSGALSRGRRGARLQEKDLALDVSRRLERRLRKAGLRVVMTRESDRFVPLDTRVAISNRQRASLFVSIHFNYSRKRHVHGSEVYHNDRGTRALSARIARNLEKVPGLRNRLIRVANFRVLRKSLGPAVLVECSYLTNAAQATRSANAEYREQLAEAIASAILEMRR